MFDQPNLTHWHRDIPTLDASVVTLGAFDGVHSGHQTLITGTVNRARELGVPAVVCTFDPPPKIYFGRATQLCPLAEKLARISALGPDHVVVFSFDETLRSLSPAAFMSRLARSRPQEIRVGSDFRFGAKQSGDVAMLARHFNVQLQLPVRCSAGEVVSSTRIRALLEEGLTAAAATLLRPGLTPETST